MAKNNKKNISVGDIVKLKSGGPKMTAIRCNSDYVECAHFNQDQEVKYTTFTQGALTKCKA